MATSRRVSRQLRTPSSPVQALACPELMTMARAEDREASMALATTTGAAGKAILGKGSRRGGPEHHLRAEPGHPDSLSGIQLHGRETKSLGAMDMMENLILDKRRRGATKYATLVFQAQFFRIAADDGPCYSTPLDPESHPHYKTIKHSFSQGRKNIHESVFVIRPGSYR